MSTEMDREISQALSKFDEAQVAGTGVYFRSGTYLTRMVSANFRKGYKGLSFIAEFEIVKVINGDDQSNREGDIVSFVKNFTTQKDAALGQTKAMVKAVAESAYNQSLSVDAIKTEVINAMTSDKQPFRGVYQYASCFPTTTKAGKEIEATSFRPCFKRDLEQYGLEQPAIG